MASRDKASGELPSPVLGLQHQYFKSHWKITPPERKALLSPPTIIKAKCIYNTLSLLKVLINFKHKAKAYDTNNLIYIYITLSSAEYTYAVD